MKLVEANKFIQDFPGNAVFVFLSPILKVGDTYVLCWGMMLFKITY